MINFIKRKLPHNLKIRKTFWIIKGFFAYLKNFWVLNWVEIIWITWTDWKTSTTIFTAQLLQNLWIKTAAMSSELYFIDWEFSENKTKRTTASPFEIFKFIKKAKEKWVKTFILEVSSHSLEQWRLFWINFDYSIITNLSQEHLDYHWTIANYAKTKAKIISKTKKSVIIKKNILEKNTFEEKIFSEKLKKIEVFVWELESKKNNLFIWNNLRFEKDWTLFDLNFWWEKISDLKLNVLWAYNIENICFWIAVSKEILKDWWEKFSDIKNNFWEKLKKSVSEIKKVPWRLDEFDFWQDFKIWISFWVTPQAIEETLKYAQNLKEKYWKVYLVFWATWWQHDHWKRPILWEVSWNFADFSILTDDETYWEDSMKIIFEVEEWIKKTTWEYKIIQDRWDAIRFALWNAKKWDIVIITWMWNFDSRNVWWVEEKWSDKEVCREFLGK